MKKSKFALHLIKYKIYSKFGKKYDIIPIINEYYKEKFDKTPIFDRAVLLPHCLIHRNCPAKFSKMDGIMCVSCGLCKCGEIRRFCKEKGYQFFITPSVGFTKRLIQRKNIKAVIGAACDYEIKKGLQSEKVNVKGVELKNNKVIPQAIYISKYDCTENNLNWDNLKKML